MVAFSIQLESLSKYKEATGREGLLGGPEIVIEPALKESHEDKSETDSAPLATMNGSAANGRQNLLLSSSSSESSSSATSPARLTPEVKKDKKVSRRFPHLKAFLNI